jgi:RNA polymerase sigma factor (sigma-70 family)
MRRKKLSQFTLDQAKKLHFLNLCYFVFNLVHDVAKTKRIVREVYISLSLNGGHLRSKTEIQEFLFEKGLEACNRLLAEREQEKIVISDVLYSGRLTEKNKEEGMIEAEVLRALYQKLDTLPRMARFVIDLHFFHSMNTKEIAEFLNLTKQTVLNHKARALKSLRTQLSNTGFLSVVLFLISILLGF